MKAELKQLSADMGKPEYEMLQGIPETENGFYNPAYDLTYIKIMLKNGGKIIGDFKGYKHIIQIPIK
ncbi:MAG: hypothetical protein IJK02_11510 [Clostridia bacterium]|nr:hypothetical protein [Clostridia bacterium]MBR0508838.1 hypothetical protein [Clostridia bacterium]MBR0537897.1 hypothetical protein [Clostridia bacterium]